MERWKDTYAEMIERERKADGQKDDIELHLILSTQLRGRCYYPHLTDEENRT